MKKIFFTIAALALLVSNSNAQDESSSKNVHLGIKAGVNIANVYDTKGEKFDADAKVGFAIGAFLTIPLGEFLGVQPEILFSQKGYQRSGSILTEDYKYTHTSNYIEVPLLVAFKPIPLLTILAGPQYSYLISEKNEFTNTLFSDPLIQKSDFDNQDVRKNTLGFVVGADVNLSNFVIGLRAGWDILNNNGDGTSTTPRYKNRYCQATIGYRL